MSPMRSKAQRAYLHANHPEIAERFEAETPKGKRLPKRAGKRRMPPPPKRRS
jgi:hypothetical protein